MDAFGFRNNGGFVLLGSFNGVGRTPPGVVRGVRLCETAVLLCFEYDCSEDM